MKHSLCSTLVAVLALSFGAVAAHAAPASRSASPAATTTSKSSNTKAARTTGKTASGQQGAHSGTKFSMTRMRPNQVASDMLDHTVALVVMAESTMKGGQQTISVTASCHLDGPNGRLEAVDKIGYRITQPTKAQSKPNPKPTAQIQGSHSIPAAGGKYKTIVVEAFLTDSKVADTKVTLTVPGDQ
ncbi:hypothetical protein BH18VER1_BH18VER1_21730 [soil metagenome]